MKDKIKLFGRRLRQFRTEKAISQEELSLRAGVQRTYVSEIELGKKNISLEYIWKFSEALETHPALFFLKAKEAEKLKKIIGQKDE